MQRFAFPHFYVAMVHRQTFMSANLLRNYPANRTIPCRLQVRNTWGSNWGMEGYIEIAMNSENVCGILSQVVSLSPPKSISEL